MLENPFAQVLGVVVGLVAFAALGQCLAGWLALRRECGWLVFLIGECIIFSVLLSLEYFNRPLKKGLD